MTYATAPAVQAAVFARLQSFAPLAALVGDQVHDAMPPGPLPPLYVALGPEVARDRSDGTGRGAVHDFLVSVVTDAPGFAGAKAAAAAVCDALVDAPLALSRGTLVSLLFLRAEARRRGPSGTRTIDLTFRARVDAG